MATQNRSTTIAADRRAASRVAPIGALIALACASEAGAQAHYYNLDAGRPTRVEDAVPTELHGVDLHLAALRLERVDRGIAYRVRAEPKISVGVLPMTALEIRAPIVHAIPRRRRERHTTALAGVGVATMHALHVEREWKPAVALAGEAFLPIGGFASGRTTYAIQLLGTKTTPIVRTHLNASLGTWGVRPPRRIEPMGSACPPGYGPTPDGGCEEFPHPPDGACAMGPADGAPARPSSPVAARCGAAPVRPGAGQQIRHNPEGVRWAVGLGADRAFPLLSTLVSADIYAERFVGLYPTVDWTAEVGLRRQWSPGIVIDLGVGRRFAGVTPSSSATLGVTYSFAARPFRAPRVVAASTASDPSITGPFEQSYLPARHNWTFRQRYARAERLLSAFDYGHAILYETLMRHPAAADAGARLDGRIYDYVVRRVLRRPPAVALEERAIGPRYATLVPELLAMFEWAHMLHRQLYDVMADERLTASLRQARAQDVLRYYRSRSDLALGSAPKSMVLMEGQPYSLSFRRVAPKFNGLIWSYHWLQIALYEALLVADDARERRANVDASLARFWAMVDSAPARLPAVMPMSPPIAPRFSELYPEAAIIFDNLHALHDVAADILASTVVPTAEKRAAILRAAAAYRDSTTGITSVVEWREHSAHMGVEQMGGRAPVGSPD